MYQVLDGLAETIGGLGQLCGQLADAAYRHAADDSFYDDRRDRFARDTAYEVGPVRGGGLDHPLNQARSAASHLGHDTD